MLTKIFYSLLFLMIIFACEQSPTGTTSSSNAALPAGTETYAYEDVPGLARAVSRSGETISAEGDLLNGQRHGAWATYDPEGIITSLTTYYQGRKQGISLTFDNQGYVDTKAYYHSDVLDGDYRKYKRKKVIESKPYENGILQGVARKYYEMGTLMEEAPYVDGKLNGIAKWYDQEGNLSIAYEYEDGQLVSKEPELDGED